MDGNFESKSSFCIFTLKTFEASNSNSNDSADNRMSSYRLYSIYIYDNDILMHNFVPCLDENGTPCLYDLLTKQTFYNQGTGNFLYQIY